MTNPADTQNLLLTLQILLEFGIVPVIWGIWKLDNSVKNLTITLHRDFVSKRDLTEQTKLLQKE